MLLIAARYYELPQWNNNLKSVGILSVFYTA